MLCDREQIIGFLRMVLDIPVNRLFVGRKSLLSPVRSGPDRIGGARLLIPLAGKIQLISFSCGAAEELFLEPGTPVLVQPGTCFSEPEFSADSLLMIEFRNDCLRLLHTSFKADQNVFYHAFYTNKQSLDHAVQSLFSRMIPDSELGRNFFHFLLEMVLDEVVSDIRCPRKKDDLYWSMLSETIAANFSSSSISREDVARMMNLHPARLSRMIRNRRKCSFSDLVNEYRLEHASDLLLNSDMPIHEIAFHCGFSYTNYFIRVFRKRYAESPLVFRKEKAK